MPYPITASLMLALDNHRGPGLPTLPLRQAGRELGLDGLAFVLAPGGRPGELVQAFGEFTVSLEDLQLTQGQGPSPDAALRGTIILVPEMALLDATRWPGLPGPVLALGVRAVFAFPLRIGIIAIGVLTGHRTSPGPMTTDQLTAALTVADLLAQYLVSRVSDPADAYRILDGTSLHFAEVHQATGMLAAQLGVDCAQALARLRGHAFRHDQLLLTIARQVLAHRVHLDADDAKGN
ncbi:ANTAR domain-containing protein [Streptomyces sp. NBC_01304]|uniref:ANTAR domain-containing protein n=1 Tax=Streptomyces sp. NBC_01304 TaxID=2903818 RepID=UPI002E139EDE|nr:ANTAR domain-containing protein [Streptomyces sp. NBC_01304]